MTGDDFYLQTDIPPGVTIDEYRRSRPREPRAFPRMVAAGLATVARRSTGRHAAGRARPGGGHERAGTLT